MVRIPTTNDLMSRLMRTLSVLSLAMCCDSASLQAQSPAPAVQPANGSGQFLNLPAVQDSRWVRNLQPATPIKGSLVIAGGGMLPPSVIDRFFELGGGSKARIVIITTASQLAGTPEVEVRFAHWKERRYESLIYLHTRDRDVANDPKFSECLTTATALWFAGGNQNLVMEAYRDTLVERRCHELLERDGVIGGTSAGAAIMTKTMIAGGTTDPVFGEGFGFLPGAIVDQHFAARNRQARLMQALNSHPGHVGLGVNECTALVVRGRTLEVVGDSEVAVVLSPTHLRPERVETLPVGKREDMVRLSRAAVGRVQETDRAWPATHPEVRKGTLVISGAGPTPTEAVSKFLTAAGGRTSSIVVLSSTTEDDSDFEATFCSYLKDAGAGQVHPVRAHEPTTMASTSLQSTLKKATGVWITGGHLDHLIESCLDAPVQSWITEVLDRGGAIGGTSAGAALHGDYLVDDGFAETRTVVAEGYQRGFGFLPGVAIGSNWKHRDGLDDLAHFKKTNPSLIGLEIPDATALIVSGTRMEVVGKNEVSVYDRSPENDTHQRPVEVVKSGQSYDFKQRKLVDAADVLRIK